jgi:hypothetical protein
VKAIFVATHGDAVFIVFNTGTWINMVYDEDRIIDVDCTLGDPMDGSAKPEWWRRLGYTVTPIPS